MTAWTDAVTALSPLIWLRFDESSGSLVDEQASISFTVNGTPDYSVSGATGAGGDSNDAMDWGLDSVDWAQSVPNINLFSGAGGATNYSIAFFANTANSGWSSLDAVLHWHTTHAVQNSFLISVSPTSFFARFQDNSNNVGTFTESGLDFSGWTFCVLVVSDSTDWELYIDGSSVNSGTFGGGFLGMTSQARRTYIARAGTTGGRFEGGIDELAWFPSALSASDVTDLYGAATGVLPSSSVPMKLKGYLSAQAASLPMLLKGITQVSAASLPMQLHGLDATHYRAQAARWGVRLVLDGADVSTSLTGRIDITHTEDASGTCRFALIGSTGTVDPDDYERKTVRIVFVGKTVAGVEYYSSVRFTGITSRAVYDPDTGRIVIDGTTDLQGQLENMSRAAITTLVGGSWSEHIFNASADGWQYAKDRLSTVASEIHVNNHGTIVVVPYAAKATADVELTDAHRFNNTLDLQRAIRRDLISRLRINLDFRFSRLRHREIECIFTLSEGFCGYLDGEIEVPQKAMIQSAADANAWTRLTPISFVEVPGPGAVCVPVRAWVGNAQDFCLGASWTAARRWAQTITEQYTIDLVATDVEAAIGVQLVEEDYGVEATFDASDYERITDFDSEPAGSSFSTKSDDWQIDATDAEQDGRTAMEAAQTCVMAKASSEILARARGNRLSVGAIYDPSITLEKTVRINTPHLVAKGKVYSITERMDLDTGKPEMVVELAISRHGGSGVASSDTLDPLPEPDQPQETVTSRTYYMASRAGGVLLADPDDETWDGWISNAYGGAQTDPTNLYRERFVIAMPEIEQTARDAAVVLASQEYEVEVPQDELTMSY